MSRTARPTLGISHPRPLRPPFFGYCEIKGRSHTGLGFCPDLSAMTFYDFFGYGKPHAGAVIFASLVLPARFQGKQEQAVKEDKGYSPRLW